MSSNSTNAIAFPRGGGSNASTSISGFKHARDIINVSDDNNFKIYY